MGDLAEAIYDVLRPLAAQSQRPRITYQDLIDQLPRGYHGLNPRSQELSAALGESQLADQRVTVRMAFWQNLDRILATGLALDAKDRFARADSWLSDIESLNAMLKLQSKISPFNEKLLHAYEWLASWFRKPRSQL